MSSKDIVISGCGAVTASGVDFQSQWSALKSGAAADKSLDSFQAAPHLSDRRMLKAVSKVDALGLVAIEALMKDAALAPGKVAPERTGLYVGAPPASSFDHEFYVEAQVQARHSVRDFGKTCMSSRPTTLLVGLPNNVLCYGAMLLDARGPNSNYTAQATSGTMAMLNAARRIERGQLDLAVAGGFTMHNEPVHSRVYGHLGLTPRMTLADGAAFVSLETRQSVEKRGGKALATYRGGALSSDGLGPLRFDRAGRALERALRKALGQADAAPGQVGLVLLSATGNEALDDVVLVTLERLFNGVLPAVGSTAPVLGHLMEACGVLELGVAAAIMAAGEVPASMEVKGIARRVNDARPLALSVVASAWGEYGVTVVRREG